MQIPTHACKCVYLVFATILLYSPMEIMLDNLLQSWFMVEERWVLYSPLQQLSSRIKGGYLKDCGAVNVLFWRYFNSVWFAIS